MTQTTTLPENGNQHRSVPQVLADNRKSDGGLSDPNNPNLAAPKETDLAKPKKRRRRLLLLCLSFVMLTGACLMLYRLTKVNRVNVKVQANARNETQGIRNGGQAKGSDNNESNDAVKMALEALQNRNGTTNNGGSTSTPTPTPSPRQDYNDLGSRSMSGPLYQPTVNNNESKDARNGSGSTSPDRLNNGVTNTAQDLIQSRANATQTIYVADSAPAIVSSANALRQTSFSNQGKAISNSDSKLAPAVLPPFGTMLPVRTQGVLFTLRNDSYARLELLQDMKGSGWSIPKGTILIGKANGSEYDRAFITVIGYLDSKENRLVKMSGEVLGSDGGSGIQGKRVVIDSGGFKRALGKIASSGMQAAGLLASGFGGQRTVILDGAGNRVISPIADEASRLFGGANADKRAFVKVEAGRPAYVMVADLPKARPTIDAPGDDNLVVTAALTDREVMELLLFATRDEIISAIPMMTNEQKTLTLKTLAIGNEKK